MGLMRNSLLLPLWDPADSLCPVGIWVFEQTIWLELYTYSIK